MAQKPQKWDCGCEDRVRAVGQKPAKEVKQDLEQEKKSVQPLTFKQKQILMKPVIFEQEKILVQPAVLQKEEKQIDLQPEEKVAPQNMLKKIVSHVKQFLAAK